MKLVIIQIILILFSNSFSNSFETDFSLICTLSLNVYSLHIILFCKVRLRLWTCWLGCFPPPPGMQWLGDAASLMISMVSKIIFGMLIVLTFYWRRDFEQISTTHIKGAGGPRPWDFQKRVFFIVYERGEPQLPDTFYQIKKYWS